MLNASFMVARVVRAAVLTAMPVATSVRNWTVRRVHEAA